MVKVTFTLDDITVKQLRQAAAKKSIPQSQAVREAIGDYHARAGRLSEVERQRMLRTLDEYMRHPPRKTSAEVNRELKAVREARRSGGRRSPTE